MQEPEPKRITGPLTEEENFAQQLEENMEVQIVGSFEGPELEEYLAEFLFALWLVRPETTEDLKGP